MLSAKSATGSTVVVLQDISAEAASVGLVCAVYVTASLWQSKDDLPALLEQLRGILLPTNDSLIPLRRAAFFDAYDETRRVVVFLEGDPKRDDVAMFVANLRDGLRVPAFGGRVLTFDSEFDGERHTIIAQLCQVKPGRPAIILCEFRNEDRRAPHRSREAWAFGLPLFLGGAS